MNDMTKSYEALIERINSIAKNATSELHNELYPQKLGEKVAMQAAEMRLIVIAKYEGISIILQRLGADISKLDAMISEEADKTASGKY